ncbi:16S rRNA (guanine(527)-N(7))-methyltransferase RsmG [Calothrix sp. UHCC 0171]|uniref:16S rRNA (guanine(527)-N(7))-methyltransferase RsmG n=1 Tax=Calothrix sp. UHCC 0171 TaxID=3110245 RepID=UPI002B20CDA8|nr:16S rRNA (guanine(527)-N(7))-methyltransferase RsmG [Calothrix sp. UHCC 0171]MEA5572186.1 16S rRNA (guanine(527)-N(7))-methyltransferase RsmG [Calothrix sp. UHCC 0171]
MLDIWQDTLNWQPSTTEQALFQQLYELILAGNQKLNLTRITEAYEFWEKHLWDSVRGFKVLLNKKAEDALASSALKIIDIGTGAGIPGIPAAVTIANSTVDLLDSTQKKITFIDQVLTELKLDNAKTIVGRAEEIGQLRSHRQQYNIALIRAVSSATVCAEYALPLIKKGGLAIIYRGTWRDEENTALANAVPELGGEIECIDQFATPLTHSIRHCLHIRKIASTPAQYPRAVGVPTQRPL